MILGNVLNIALSDTLREVILWLRLYNFHFNAQLDNILHNPETLRFQWFFENPLEIHIYDLIRLTRRQFNTLVSYNILHSQDDLYLFDLLEDNLPPFNPVERISDWPINTYEIDQRVRPANLTSQTTTDGRSYTTTPTHGSVFYRPLHNNPSDNNNIGSLYVPLQLDSSPSIEGTNPDPNNYPPGLQPIVRQIEGGADQTIYPNIPRRACVLGKVKDLLKKINITI